MFRRSVRSWLARSEPSHRVAPERDTAQRRIAFVFSTRGTRLPGMARDLYYEAANFREALQKCSRIIEQRLGWSLEQELHRSAQDCQLGRSEEHMEPALTAIQISLFDLLQSYGLR